MVQESDNSTLLIDVHSHVCTPSYLALLRARTSVPFIDEQDQIRLYHSPGSARTLGPEWWDANEKMKFMDGYGIAVSVVSPPTPSVNFLPPSEAIKAATTLNDELATYCSASPSLYALAVLPLAPGVSLASVVNELDRIRNIDKFKGVMIGTRGFATGLDDEVMMGVWEALATKGVVAFIHPESSIGSADGDSGSVLPAALGDPIEITLAVSRLILSGILDRLPTLTLVLSHSGGSLPGSSSRIANSVTHDTTLPTTRLQNDFRYYLGQMYYDTLASGAEELALLERTIARASKFEGREEELAFHDRVTDRNHLLAPTDWYPGCERILFGTDHPLLPLSSTSSSSSSPTGTHTSAVIDEALDSICTVPGWTDEDRERVLGGNAKDLFGISDEELL